MVLLSCVHSQRLCVCISGGSGSTLMDEDEQHSHHRYRHSTPGCTVMATKAHFTALPACFACVSSGQTSLHCFAATLRIQCQEAIGNWHKLKYRRCHLKPRKHFFIESMTEHVDRLFREVMEPPSMEILKSSLDMCLTACSRHLCCKAGLQSSLPTFAMLSFGDMILPWGFFQLGVRMWAEHIPDPRVRKHCEVPKFQYKQSVISIQKSSL